MSPANLLNTNQYSARSPI